MITIKKINILLVFIVSFGYSSLLHADPLHELFTQTMQDAESGNVVAMYEVGRMFGLGIGVKKSREQAFSWYTKAANKNHAPAAYKLGMAYYAGKGVAQNHKKAKDWFSVAAKRGHKKSRQRLAKMYHKGEGGTLDEVKAERLVQDNPVAPKSVPTPEEKPVITNAEEQPKEKAVEVKITPKLKKVVVKAKPKPAKKTWRNLILSKQWVRGKRDALVLPSKAVECHKDKKSLLCLSKVLPARMGNLPYTYRVMSVLDTFSDSGSFSLHQSYRLEDTLERVIDAYEDEDEDESSVTVEQVLTQLHSQKKLLKCQISKNQIIHCEKESGKTLQFSAVFR